MGGWGGSMTCLAGVVLGRVSLGWQYDVCGCGYSGAYVEWVVVA